jgi:hypothetical protein
MKIGDSLFGIISKTTHNIGRNYTIRKGNYSSAENLKQIEKLNSIKLSPKNKKLVDDYAIEVFGSRVFSPWLYVYTLNYGNFVEGWIPSNYYETYVSPYKGINLAASFKTFTNAILKTDGLPDIAYYMNGVLYDRNYSPIHFSDLQHLVAKNWNAVFVKKDSSMRGSGIHKLKSTDLVESTFTRIGNCVIQYPLENHEFFTNIITGAVSTLRITTVVKPEGKIEYRAAILRLGRKGHEWIKSSTSVRVNVLNNEGDLDPTGYTTDWQRWQFHPDTHFVFADQRIPLFKKAVETCVGFHSMIPHFRVIGWDVAICSDNSVKLMECNGALAGIIFSQATAGPCFSGLNWEKLHRE